MNTNPKISVIIPTYNRAHLIERAIKSVLSQTYQNFELVIVDDGSTDNTDDVINKLQQQDDRIIYLKHDKNKGGSATRNTGIKASRGECIAFLDSDDEWLPEKLSCQMEAIIRQNVSIVTCFCDSYDVYGKKIKEYHQIYSGNPLYEHMFSNIAGTSLILVKKNDLKKVGFFENVPSQQDQILILKLLGIGLNVFTVEKVLVKYFEHNDFRISGITDRKIEGERISYDFQKKYFRLINKKQQTNLYLNHLNKMFTYHLYLYGRKKSLIYYLKAFILKPFDKQNIINTVKIITNYYKFKEKIHG